MAKKKKFKSIGDAYRQGHIDGSNITYEIMLKRLKRKKKR
jgi:hypothetical protein